MPPSRLSWFAVSSPGHNSLVCAQCGRQIDLGFPSLDHHSGSCPVCGTESVFFTWNDVLVQVVPGKAPAELVQTLRWTQENLDELEFVTVLSSLAEIGAWVQKAQPDRSGILKG